MQPTICSRCKKNVAVVFITKIENGQTVNEGLCLKCAKELGIKPINDMMSNMGVTDEELENLSREMLAAFGGEEDIPDADGDDDESGKTATFPFLNKLFGGGNHANPPAAGGNDNPRAGGPEREKGGSGRGNKRKFLENYCISLTQRAKDNKLDKIVGREEELERVIQILNRRQKNNPCLIGEPGVGKTAIAEGLAQKIIAGEVPYKLTDKEVWMLDLTALVAGTQ
ncbi:MAG: ATP-dependent Clp protease ATP-binding subunit, partial [Oscillospiraceae bacterium]|nr:ATP-dependent Clp protease ATP-binding subunit [Oscillospiraceae bacterium]